MSNPVSGSIPSWVSNLKDSTIQSDITADLSAGVMTYGELAKLFVDVYSEASVAANGLSVAQYYDLVSVAANLGSLNTDSYLAYITNALVDGNADNATFTGGGSGSISLGDLGIGSTKIELGELIQKWFWGGDTPSNTYSDTYGTYTVNYQTSNLPLFSTAGVSINDISQGNVGDCFFLGAVAELAAQDPSAISQMFENTGNGTYGVRFYVGGQSVWVTVNTSIAMYDGAFAFNNAYAHPTSLWVNLLENAYTELSTSGNLAGVSGNTAGNSYNAINGGYPQFVMSELTGASQETMLFDASGSWEQKVAPGANPSFANAAYQTYDTNNAAVTLIENALLAHDDVVLSSYTQSRDPTNNLLDLDSAHAFAVLSCNVSAGTLTLRNPWGNATNYWEKQYWNTTFTINISALSGTGDYFAIDNAAGHTAPVLLKHMPEQYMRLGAAFSFTLYAGSFTDPQGTSLTYTATTTGGGALPSWMKFNAATLTLSGVAPSSVISALPITVTATDYYGLSSSENFQIGLVDAITVNQTPNQGWVPNTAESLSLSYFAFTDSEGAALAYSAKLSNGQALPSWLSFNAQTGTFSGTTPGSFAPIAITVTATNEEGISASQTFTISEEHIITINQTASQLWVVGTAESFTLATNTFTDDEGSPLTYSASLSNGSPLPSWLTFNAVAETFTGTPPTGFQSQGITVTATDSQGISNSETFYINPPASPYSTFFGEHYIADNAAFSFITPFYDPNGASLTYSAVMSNGQALPSWLGFNTQTGTFTGEAPNTVGNLAIAVTATDSLGASATSTYYLNTVAAPTLLNQTDTQTWYAGQNTSFALPTDTFSYPEGSDLFDYYVGSANGNPWPSWLSFNYATATFSGTAPSGSQPLVVNVTVRDLYGFSAQETFTIDFINPIIVTQTANQYWGGSQANSFTLPQGSFYDPQSGSSLTYTATLSNGQQLPSWLTFNASTLTFSGTSPGSFQPIQITVTATDAYWGLSSSDTFTISELAPPVAPQTAAQYWQAGVSFFDTVFFVDPNNSRLTYTATLSNGQALPSWLNFNSSTGTFSGVAPGTDQFFAITITATDGYGLSSSETFNAGVALPPVASNYSLSTFYVPGKPFDFKIPANFFTDPNGSALTYSLTYSANQYQLPSGITFNSTTGEISGTYSGTSPFSYFTITAKDSYGLFASTYFYLDEAPPIYVNAHQSALNWATDGFIDYTVANVFVDGSGLPLTYTATLANGQALPSWISFNAQTGAFTGTAPSSFSTFQVVVTASDNLGLTATTSFSVSEGQPIVVSQLTTFFLAPGINTSTYLPASFYDQYGLSLTYSATLANGAALPSWLSINPVYGVLSATKPPSFQPFTVNFVATDADGNTASATIEIDPAQAPTVTQTAPQIWVAGNFMSLDLAAANTFTDPNGLRLTYAATLANGSPLPYWLSFYTSSGLLSGSVPTNFQGTAITITATDTAGLSVSETITVSAEVPPVVTVIAQTVPKPLPGASIAASSLFAASDSQPGATIAAYEFYDATPGIGSVTIGGVTLAKDTTSASVSASQLGTVYVIAGTGADTVYERAYDGFAWGNWTAVTVTGGYVPPTVTAVSANVTSSSAVPSYAFSQLFTTTDAQHQAIQSYQFYDSASNPAVTAAGAIEIGGSEQAVNSVVSVPESGISGFSFVASGTDTLYARVNDGNGWSNWTAITITAPPDTPPVVTVIPQRGTQPVFGTSIAASSLFSAGASTTSYEFYDATPGIGYVTIDGARLAKDTTSATVSASDLGNVNVIAGNGADTVYERAYDGFAWGNWTAVTVTGVYVPPTITAQSLAPSSSALPDYGFGQLFTTTDAQNLTIQSYQFYDAASNPAVTAAGAIEIGGVAQAANTVFSVPQSGLSGFFFVASGTDTLYARVSDGIGWSNWAAITITAPTDQPPIVTAIPQTATKPAPGTSIVVSSLFSAGASATAYEFYDATPGIGSITIGGATLAKDTTSASVLASALSTVDVIAGNGADTVYERAYDGLAWGNWTAVTVTGSSSASTAAPTSHIVPSFASSGSATPSHLASARSVINPTSLLSEPLHQLSMQVASRIS